MQRAGRLLHAAPRRECAGPTSAAGVIPRICSLSNHLCRLDLLNRSPCVMEASQGATVITL